jgi:hypothetical protein
LLVAFSPRLCFVKTFKTASTSTEALFQIMFLGSRPSETIGWELTGRGFCTPRNSYPAVPIAQRLSYSLAHPQLWQAGMELYTLRNHSAPSEIRKILGDRFFTGATKVVNVRNPFDLVVSAFKWLVVRKGKRVKFSEWLPHHRRPRVNEELCSVSDESWRFIRFERLAEDVEALADAFGLSVQGAPRYKESAPFQNQGVSYRELYTRKDRARVELVYSDWFQKFGYEW